MSDKFLDKKMRKYLSKIKENNKKMRKYKNIIDRDIQDYINASQSIATKRAYASDLQHFLTNGGIVPCTPKCLAKYLAKSANDGFTVATLQRRITSIHQAHIDKQHPSPAHNEVVRQVMRGIRRTLGTKQRQVKPLVKDDLLLVLDIIKKNHTPVRAARDSALLLIGFASAMRRSELVGVRVEHLTFLSMGLEIEIPVSKTDQEKRGRTIFIPRANGRHCPVISLMHWLNISGIRTGPVFRAVNRYDGIAKRGLTPQSVALIVKAAVAETGADAQRISGHSLRAGYCTSAAEQGQQSWQIREQTGHKSDVTLARYIRRNVKNSVHGLL